MLTKKQIWRRVKSRRRPAVPGVGQTMGGRDTIGPKDWQSIESDTSSTRSSSDGDATASTGTPPQPKSVTFKARVTVVLICNKDDLGVNVKRALWWSSRDVNTFRETWFRHLDQPGSCPRRLSYRMGNAILGCGCQACLEEGEDDWDTGRKTQGYPRTCRHQARDGRPVSGYSYEDLLDHDYGGRFSCYDDDAISFNRLW